MDIHIVQVVIDVFEYYGETIRFDYERLAEALSEEAPHLVDEAYLIVEGMKLHVFDVMMFDEDIDVHGYVDYLIAEADFKEADALFMVSVFETLIEYYHFTFEIPNIDDLIKNAREQHLIDHLFVIGKMYFEGFGVKQDYEKSFAFMSELYSQGDYRGAFYLGYMYEHGYGVEQDEEKAFLYYESYEDDLSLLRLGTYYMSIDVHKALGYLSKCQHVQGYYNYGLLLERQHLYSDAFQIFFKGAKLYHSECLYKVGTYLSLGLGTTIDQKAAYRYLKQGYYRFHKDCAYQLAMILFDGIVVKKNEKQAIRYLQQAAKMWSQDACLKLAYFYNRGLYVEKNIKRASEYYKKAQIISEFIKNGKSNETDF